MQRMAEQKNELIMKALEKQDNILFMGAPSDKKESALGYYSDEESKEEESIDEEE